MPRPQRFLWLCLLVLTGILTLPLWRSLAQPRSAPGPQALAPGGTPAPFSAASARGGPTTIQPGVAFADAPVDLKNLPPAPPRDEATEAEGEANRIDGLLTDEQYQAELRRARAMPPDASLARGVSALATGPALGANFNGLDIMDCCSGGRSTPPDPDIAVGPNHILVAVNSAFAVFNKAGLKQSATINAYSFWSGAQCTVGGESKIFDPVVAYDPGADRFIVGYDAKASVAQESFLCLAVSQTNDPTGAWYRFSFNVKVTSGLDNFWLDYPHLGVWHDAVYMTGNYFRFVSPTSSDFTRVIAIDKAAMYANAGVVSTRFVDNPQDFYGFSAFTLQPAKASDTYPTSGPAYFLASDCLFLVTPGTCDAAELDVFAMTPDFSGSGTTFGLIGHPAVGSFNSFVNVDVPQGGASDMVQANDSRLLDAQWHTDNTIYATHAITCNPGSVPVVCVRWYQLGNLNSTPSLLQQGTLASDGEYRFFPDLAVDAAGNMAIAYSFSTASGPIGIRAAGRQVTDAPGTTSAEVVIKVGEAVYGDSSIPSDTSPYRWGDYTGMVVDPTYPCQLWYVGEYAKSGVGDVNWGTYIAQLSFSGVGGTAQEVRADGPALSSSGVLTLPVDIFMPLIANRAGC